MSQWRPGYLVGRSDRLMRTSLEEALADSGLSVAELTALSVLAASPGLSNARLARRSLVTPQAMHKVVTSLERQGFVERHAESGRNLRADITQAGRDLLAVVEPRIAAAEAQFLAPLSAAERTSFVEMLEKVGRVTDA